MGSDVVAISDFRMGLTCNLLLPCTLGVFLSFLSSECKSLNDLRLG